MFVLRVAFVTCLSHRTIAVTVVFWCIYKTGRRLRITSTCLMASARPGSSSLTRGRHLQTLSSPEPFHQEEGSLTPLSGSQPQGHCTPRAEWEALHSSLSLSQAPTQPGVETYCVQLTKRTSPHLLPGHEGFIPSCRQRGGHIRRTRERAHWIDRGQ